MKKAFNIVAGAALALSMAGCGSSYLTARNANPIVKDSIGNGVFDRDAQVGAFGTDASRRMILVKLREDATKICAEPSPDAAAELAKKLAVALSAQVQGAGDGKLNAESDIVSKMPQLFTRTQGLQLFRDGSFLTCQDFMNSAIDGAELNRRFDKLLGTAAGLIEIELKRPQTPPPVKSAP